MKYSARLALALCFMCCTLLWGCSGKKSSEVDHSGPPRDNTPQVLTPSADGTVVFDNDYASIDASNQSQGYIMVSYSGSCEKVKVQITGPDQNTYTYLLTARNEYTTFPLSSGNGTYLIQIMENVGGDSYVVSLTHDVDVQIENEFLPFLYPNQYVDFNADSQAVAKGSELAANTWSDLEVVQNIYNFVIKNISYDMEKATSVSYGYIPNVDDTLTSGTGICFDYAALMAAMLRSQNIPTKLEVGYSGDAYHAWISTYIDETGWVDNIIEFDGHDWQIMDPTLAASNDSESVKKYVGDGSHYVVKYSY